jgi:hypothetical protein
MGTPTCTVFRVLSRYVKVVFKRNPGLCFNSRKMREIIQKKKKGNPGLCIAPVRITTGEISLKGTRYINITFNVLHLFTKCSRICIYKRCPLLLLSQGLVILEQL